VGTQEDGGASLGCHRVERGDMVDDRWEEAPLSKDSVGGEGRGACGIGMDRFGRGEQLPEIRRMEVLPSAAIEWSEETCWTVAGRRHPGQGFSRRRGEGSLRDGDGSRFGREASKCWSTTPRDASRCPFIPPPASRGRRAMILAIGSSHGQD
jgi:hypothetical protein